MKKGLQQAPPKQNSARRKGPSSGFCANPIPQLCPSVQAGISVLPPMGSAMLHHPALPQGWFPNSAAPLSQVSKEKVTAAVAREPDRAKLDVPETAAESWVKKRVILQLRSQRRSCGSTILCLPAAPSTLRTRMVHLTGCYSVILHCWPLKIHKLPQIHKCINLQPNILIWADLWKELHPKTMQDEQLQISWLFTLFCIQKFSAGIDNLNQCCINKIEHKERKTKPQEG